MALSLSALIASVGDENVQFANLDDCMIKANYSAKDGYTTVSFATDAVLNPDGFEKMALIVWLPRDKVKEVLAAHKRLERGNG